jgi:hypothetical protein
MRNLGLIIAIALMAATAGVARATVIDAAPGGFQVQETVKIAAPAKRVWAALGKVGDWWNPEHSWAGDAHNLSLDLTPGGCFCEALPKDRGGVRHMTVVYDQPMKQVILDGTLGPLMFSGAAGHLVWGLEEKDGVTTLTQTYYVGGYFPGGLDKIAPAVDGVLGSQLTRLKAYIETGKP